MAKTFNGSSNVIMLNSTDVSTKAEGLGILVINISAEIEKIDEFILDIATKGLMGTAVNGLLDTYIKNRDIIDSIVRNFAQATCVLKESAAAHSNVNEEAATAAKGGI